MVIELGSSWLQQHAHDPFAGDVAVAVALAHCDEAAYALEAGNGTVVLQACKHLETSLQLLREFKMAAGLQHLIMQTLEASYQPAPYACTAPTLQQEHPIAANAQLHATGL